MDGPGTAFDGFPVAALDFYDDLEMDNTKSFWTAHKDTYDTAVKAPMAALVAALEPEFGKAKLFRPYRDVRFAKDKTPYKTHQGGFVQAGQGTGWYVQVGARASGSAWVSTTPGLRGWPPSAPPSSTTARDPPSARSSTGCSGRAGSSVARR